jgi:hypothetical protein
MHQLLFPAQILSSGRPCRRRRRQDLLALAAPHAPGVAAGSGSAPAAGAGAIVAASIDELRVEETLAHKVKLGRWRRVVLDVIQKPLFWQCTSLMQKVLQPLQHAMAVIHMKHDESEQFELGSPLAQFVMGRAVEFEGQYEELFKHDSWFKDLLKDGVAVGPPESSLVLAVEVILHAAGGFHRRVVELTLKPGT